VPAPFALYDKKKPHLVGLMGKDIRPEILIYVINVLTLVSLVLYFEFLILGFKSKRLEPFFVVGDMMIRWD
jgi:hypothetical protein